jgi:hypothetical protein
MDRDFKFSKKIVVKYSKGKEEIEKGAGGISEGT